MAGALKQNWFWPVAVVLLGLVWGLGQASRPEAAIGLEPALLFDVFVTIPALFALCYARTMSRGQLAIRIVSLQCLGIWLAGKIVPVDAQFILPELGWLRTLGLAVLIAIELRLTVSLFRMIFRGDAKEADMHQLGMPPLLAKLALAEARFWRWVFSVFRK